MYVCKNAIKNCKNIDHSIKSKFQHTLNSTFDEKNVWTNSHRFPFTVGNDKGNAYNSVNVHELRVRRSLCTMYHVSPIIFILDEPFHYSMVQVA